MSSTRGNIEELFENLSERRDRRACPRTNSPLLSYIDLGDGNGGIALNISEGGLAITAAGTLFEDYFPNIRFQLPKITGWIETSGRVIWTSESKKGAGICFEGITEVDRQRIRHWISSKDSGGEIDNGTSYDSEEKHPSDSPRRKKEPRKLEVLSEADEARFAAMFPSESTLQIARDHHGGQTEAEREIPERTERNSPEVVTNLLPDAHRDREDLSGRSFVQQNSQTTEGVSKSDAEAIASEHGDQESELDSQDAEPASDEPYADNESADTIVFPRRRWIIDRADDSLTPEELPTEEHRIAHLEAVNFLLDPDHTSSEEYRVQAAVRDRDEIDPAHVGPSESPAMEEKTPGEWILPTWSDPQEADWRQQFVWNGSGAAAESAVPPVVEKEAKPGNVYLIAGVILLVAAVCFAGGLMVGNGSVIRLLGLDGAVVATNPPAAAATSTEPNSPKSTEISESATQQSKSDSATASRDVSSNSSTSGLKDAGAARNETSGSNPDAAQSAEAEDDQEAPANNRRPQTRSLAPSSGAGSASGLKAESRARTEQTSPQPPTAAAAAPESGLRSQSQHNANTPNYSEATVDKPYSELQSPVLVTPPDEKSGPFRLAFPEAAVSASRTLAISAQRFVSIPVQAGPASGHRPERLQAGVLIYHLDPVLPTSGEEIGGTVKVRATIGKGGDIVDVRAISGPPSLIPRVVRAVREWRYTVTLLDGQPLGAEEDVVVEFRPKS
jgi:PilZ domain/Gram-negative bacterial TonB protein C-terminal